MPTHKLTNEEQERAFELFPEIERIADEKGLGPVLLALASYCADRFETSSHTEEDCKHWQDLQEILEACAIRVFQTDN